MSTAEEYRRVAWHYLKLAEATSNPRTGASLLNLADYWAKRASVGLRASATQSDAQICFSLRGCG
jgi:hypothetical protein